ncbi:glycosyltransferase [Paraburkholderia sp. JHI869]|uniref:glycosyltransferase n=1 Tax=Paraburkholderia sp. JHI869 TaxID=3112959 RepID=UPI003176C7C4
MFPPSADQASAPCVSVVTPTWNREMFLPLAYRAFASQRAPGFGLEWIVIDDSDAPSAFMASLNDERVVYRHLRTLHHGRTFAR